MRAAFLGVLFLGLGCGPARGESRPERPNIVVLLAGDMGFSDLGCYGGEIETPHLDRLAAEGVRFTQFYNTACYCPTRASLLTGLYPRRAGVGHRVEDRGRPGYQGFLNDRCVTVPEVLRAAGYRTMMTGKWHVGGERPHWPVDRGFDRYFGVIDGGSNYFKLDRGRTMARDGGRVSPPARADFYMTDAFADAALEFLDEARGGGEAVLLYVGCRPRRPARRRRIQGGCPNRERWGTCSRRRVCVSWRRARSPVPLSSPAPRQRGAAMRALESIRGRSRAAGRPRSAPSTPRPTAPTCAPTGASGITMWAAGERP
jgi:hypothetical protein